MRRSPLEAYLASHRDRQLAELVEWLRIPSISTLPEHREDLLRAARWLAARMEAAGLEHVEVLSTSGHPVVRGDWLHAGPDAPTVLVYGHYDVQPVDPLERWETPPFEPTVRSGPRGEDLYARGASDDKGQVFVHVKAVEALLAVRGRLPVNVKFVVEGEEEVGSPWLMQDVSSHPGRYRADVVLISDSPILGPDQPVIVYGLRGLWAGQVTVRGPGRDLHSGSFGGAVHNPNQALAELLAALHDGQGRVAVPGFYDRVRPLSPREREALAQVPFDEERLRAESGVPRAWGEPEYTPVERIGARPTLEINGLWGGFTGPGIKTVIPAEAHAKLSCRLVPDQDPEEIGRLIQDHLQALAPPTVQVEVTSWGGAPAVLVPLDSPAVQAAAQAYVQGFGVSPLFSREGGSIPVAAVFQQVLEVPIVLMGFGLPDDNLHAPNERFHLPNFYRGIRTSIAFMDAMATQKGG